MSHTVVNNCKTENLARFLKVIKVIENARKKIDGSFPRRGADSVLKMGIESSAKRMRYLQKCISEELGRKCLRRAIGR